MTSTKRRAYYVTDPMCSWCWGFSPVIEEIRRTYADKIQFSLVVGGLRVGTTEKMTRAVRDMVLHHWKEVHKLTGQEFCYDFNMPETFLYDTGTSCRAVVTVRSLAPVQTFPYLISLHKAFYVENRDLTDVDILADLAEDLNVDRDAFMESFETRDIKRETVDDFSRAQNWGIRGFPAIVLEEPERFRLLTIGYQPFDTLQPQLEAWIESRESADRSAEGRAARN